MYFSFSLSPAIKSVARSVDSNWLCTRISSFSFFAVAIENYVFLRLLLLQRTDPTTPVIFSPTHHARREKYIPCLRDWQVGLNPLYPKVRVSLKKRKDLFYTRHAFGRTVVLQVSSSLKKMCPNRASLSFYSFPTRRGCSEYFQIHKYSRRFLYV